jgi:signal transduction histidine kinase
MDHPTNLADRPEPDHGPVAIRAMGALLRPLVDKVRASPVLTLIVGTVAIAVAYAGVGFLGLWSATQRDLWPTLWLPSAVGLTAVAFWGPRASLGVGLGALLMRAVKDPDPVFILTAFVPNFVEAYLGGHLLGRWFGLPLRRLGVREIPRLVLTLALITNISAVLGTGLLVAVGEPAAKDPFRAWWSWWSGDAAAVILIAPIWLWGRETEFVSKDEPLSRRLLFFIGVLMGLILSLMPMPEGATPMWRPTLAYIPYLLIHWASLSLGARSVAFGGASVGVVVSLATNLGRGPFATGDPVASYDAACLFNLVTGTSTLWLSTLAAEGNLAAQAIARHREDLEETVRIRTRDLEERTQELQSFSYAVSHDLRAPLRGISGWILALEEDCGDKLDADGRRLLDRIRSEAQRMGTLIEGLLSLSRISSTEIRSERVDISAMATNLLGRIAEARPDRTVRTTVTPGLEVEGDPTLCELALTNLLENAWKFTSRTPGAHIEVLPAETADGRGFRVRDNGAGFDPTNRNRLFIPFQRFHRASEFPGTGIGLATVHRIAARHTGSVEVSSAPGAGTTVSLIFPFTKTHRPATFPTNYDI